VRLFDVSLINCLADEEPVRAVYFDASN